MNRSISRIIIFLIIAAAIIFAIISAIPKIQNSLDKIAEGMTREGEPLRTAEDLKRLTGSSSTFVLENDIDLEGVEWTPIENFSGKLIGKGYSIKNLKIDSSADNVGFFSVLKGIVEGVRFENASVNVSGSHENIGILCGLLEGEWVKDVYASGEVNAEKSKNVGGIIGQYTAEWIIEARNLQSEVNVTANENVGGICGYMYCHKNAYNDIKITLAEHKNSGTIIGSGSYVGGIIGYYLSEEIGNEVFALYASNLENTGDVTGKTYVGGLFGYAYSDTSASYIQNSKSSADITAEAMVGGLAGQLEYIQMNNCDNAGTTITATKYIIDGSNKYAYVGGYVGRGFIASNCTNTVDIDYTAGGSYVGGIMGYSRGSDSYEMIELKNTATINGENYVGGIFGYSSANRTFSASNFENEGDITGNEYVGGIFGYMNCSMGGYSNPTATLTQFKNSGKVTATGSYVGGAIGYGTVNNSYNSDVFTLYASDFENTGDVTGKTYVGGLFGYGYSDGGTSYIQDSSSSANIEAEAMVGGLAGQLEYIQMNNCDNEGTTITATKYIIDGSNKYAYVGGYAGKGFVASDCTNTVDIDYTAGGSYVGGIMGYSRGSDSYEMTELKNEGNVSGSNYVGGIFGYSSANWTFSASNFENKGDIVGNEYIGGICGYMNCYSDTYHKYPTVTLTQFKNSGTVTATGSYIGGIIGYCRSENAYSSNETFVLYASDFENTGDVTGKTYVGGLFGYGYSDAKASYIQDSSSSANIEAEAMVGGLAGQLEYIQMNNCDNAGTTITATKYIIDGSNKYAYVGGYVGRGFIASNCTNTVDIDYTAGGSYVGGIMGYSRGSDSYEMIELKNTATINGENYVGGIFGYSSANWTFSASVFENEGDITGNEYIGGICGYMNCYSDTYHQYPTVTLTQLINSGTITATGSYVGGIIGYYRSENAYSSNETFVLHASDFENTGDVTGKSFVGGLIGFAYSDDTDSCIRDSKSSANITAEYYIGGLAGMLQNIQMDSCENTGSTVTATGYTEYKDSKCVFLGGFVGRAYIINNCTNTIDINYEGDANYVGGIAGHLYMWHSFSLKNLKNEGTVEGYNYVGGIFGYFQCYMDSWTAASTVTIEGFENSGIVKGNCYVGGSIGWFHADAYGKTFTLYATGFDHTGEVWGGLYVGGWLGYGYTDSSSSIISDSNATGQVQGTKWCGKYVGLVENIQIDYIEQ